MSDTGPEARPIPGTGDSPETLFASFVARVELGEVVEFDDWIRDHPDHADELRRLYSGWQIVHAGRPRSISFFRGGERERPRPAPGFEPGRVIGDFRLIELIGQGGMGQVWEAEQVSLRRRVALKFVRPERVTAKQLSYFEREARAGGRLAHPGIVAVHGFGESDGIAWIAMERIEGCWTLRDYLDERGREPGTPPGHDRQVAEFFVHLADALHAAHRAGVIHRDLKPQNILIAPDEKPKVTDFGLAKITDESALSQTGEFAGTYFYMSPEQVAARRMGLDHRTDIFSLGAVLYETLSLQRPFPGDTSHQVAEQILTKDPAPLRSIRSRIPGDFAAICGKALEKDRDRRYATMADLAADLRRFLEGRPVLAKPPGPVRRAASWVRRHPAVTTVTALSLLGLLAISSLAARLDAKAEEASRQADQASRMLYASQIHAIESALQAGRVDEAQDLHRRCDEKHRGWEWHNLGLAVDQSLWSLTDVAFEAIPDWSPDGRLLAVPRGEGLCTIHDGITGQQVRRIDAGDLDFDAVAWRPTGGELALFGRHSGAIRIVDETSGATIRDLSPGALLGSAWWAWSPSGSRAAAVVNGRLSVLSAHARNLGEGVAGGDGDEVPNWTREVSGFESLAWSPDGSRICVDTGFGRLEILDGVDGRTLAVIENAYTFAWGPGAGRIVAVSNDSLNIHDATSGALVASETSASFSVGPTWPFVAAWSRDGRWIACFDPEAPTIYCYDEGLSLSRLLVGHRRSPEHFAARWCPNSRHLVSVSDGEIRVWDIARAPFDGERARDSVQMRAPWGELGLDPASDRVMTIQGGRATLRDLSLSTYQLEESQVPLDISHLQWSREGARIASVDSNGRVRVHGPSISLVKAGSRDVFPNVVRMDWSPDSRYVVLGTGGAQVIVVDSDTAKQVASVPYGLQPGRALEGPGTWHGDSGHWHHGPRAIPSKGSSGDSSAPDWVVMDVHPSSGVLGLAMDDGCVTLWELGSGEQVGAFSAGVQPEAVAWHPALPIIAIAAAGEPISIWNTTSYDLIRTLDEAPDAPHSLSWSPDGRRLASVSDVWLRVWDPESGSLLHTRKGLHLRPVELSWSSDSHQIRWQRDGEAVLIDSRALDVAARWEAARARDRAWWAVSQLRAEHFDPNAVSEAIRSDPRLSDSEKDVAGLLVVEQGVHEFLSLARQMEGLCLSRWPRPDNYERAHQLAKRLPQGPFALTLKGLALLRARRFEGSIDCLERAEGLGYDPGDEGVLARVNELELFVKPAREAKMIRLDALAMAYYHVGKDAEARDALARATALLAERPLEERLRRLHGEAVALIGRK